MDFEKSGQNLWRACHKSWQWRLYSATLPGPSGFTWTSSWPSSGLPASWQAKLQSSLLKPPVKLVLYSSMLSSSCRIEESPDPAYDDDHLCCRILSYQSRRSLWQCCAACGRRRPTEEAQAVSWSPWLSCSVRVLACAGCRRYSQIRIWRPSFNLSLRIHDSCGLSTRNSLLKHY